MIPLFVAKRLGLFELRYVDPSSIKYETTSNKPLFLFWRFGKYGKKPIQPNSLFEELKKGKNFMETKEYYDAMGLIQKGIAFKGLTTKGDIDLFFSGYMNLIRDIKNYGYKTQKELGTNKPYDEIQVSEDSDGSLILECSGTHRLHIAKELGLEKVPVIVIRKKYGLNLLRN